MNRRLQQFLDLENLSPARLADMLGVQRSGVSHILSGRNKPGFDFIQKLLTKFPALSADWFLTGKGKPYKEMNIQGGSTTFQNNNSGKNSTSQWSQNSTTPSAQNGNFGSTPSSNFEMIQDENFEFGYNENSSTGKNQDFEFEKNGNFGVEKNDNFGSDNSSNLNQRYYNENKFQNNEFFFNDNKSTSNNNYKEDLLKNNNSNNPLDSKSSDNITTDNISHKVNFTDYSSVKEEVTFPSTTTADFFNEIEPAEREMGKSHFLEQNGNISQNSRYTPDNEHNTFQNRGSYRRENQINGPVKGIDGKKRSIKRIIVFYDDGTFEEL